MSPFSTFFYVTNLTGRFGLDVVRFVQPARATAGGVHVQSVQRCTAVHCCTTGCATHRGENRFESRERTSAVLICWIIFYGFKSNPDPFILTKCQTGHRHHVAGFRSCNFVIVSLTLWVILLSVTSKTFILFQNVYLFKYRNFFKKIFEFQSCHNYKLKALLN